MRVGDALVGVSVLCAETAPLIYFTERRSGSVDIMRAIFRRVSATELRMIASTITLTEILTKPLRVHDTALVMAYQMMLQHTDDITLIDVNAAIAYRAADLRAHYDLKTPDALHLATAIEAGADAFLTNDRDLRRVNEVRVLVLDDLELDEQTAET